MNRYRMLALDVDGTALNPRGEITPRVRAAIARAMHAGMIVTLATGRNLRAALPVARELGLSAPLIVNNGALVVAPATGQILLQRPLERSVAVGSVRLLQRMGFTAYASRCDLTGPDLFVEQPPSVPESACSLGREPHDVRQVYDLAGSVAYMDPLKVMALDRTPAIEAAAERLRRNLPGPHEVLVMPEGPGYSLLEVSARGVSKATGLERLLALTGISPSETIAIGDNVNDLEMLRYAGIGVAMGNAMDDVKRIAGRVTASNDEDGVALFLEQHVLRVA